MQELTPPFTNHEQTSSSNLHYVLEQGLIDS